MVETVTITLEKYDELVKNKVSHDYLIRHTLEIETQIQEAKRTILKMSINDYKFRNYDLETLTDIDNYNFGLDNKKSLLKLMSYQELIDFIKEEKARREKEDEE